MAARSDILEKVKKSRQEAERRIQESNQKAEAQRKASEKAYQQNTSQETKKAASYMKQYSAPSRAGNSVADYASKRKQATSWYKGSTPTEIETLAKIAQESQRDRAFGEKLYGYYEQAKQEGHWAETYDKATSQYLTALGLTADQVNDELFIQAAPYMNAGIITNAGNQSTAKRNSTAANFAGLYDDYQKTKVLQSEEAEAMKEAQYWIAKGLTDEEIIQKLNIGGEGSKYSNLTKAFNKTKTGEYEPTTAPIQLLTSYGVQGMLYGLRNPNDASGDYKMDAVKAAMGRGVQVSATPDEIARRTPGSETWNPYANGTTMDDEAILFGVGKEFSADWTDQERNAVLARGDKKEIDAFTEVYNAEQYTREVEDELVDLTQELDLILNAGGDLDADTIINDLFYDDDGNAKYKKLAELDESLLSGEIKALTRGIDYDRKSIEQRIRDYVTAKNTLAQATTDPATMEQVVQDRKQATAAENGGTLLTPGALSDAVDESVRKSILFDGNINPDTIREGLAWVGNQLSEFSQNRRNRRKEKIEQEKQQKEEETQKKLDMSEQLIGEPDESSALPEPVAVIASEGASDVSPKARTMTAEEYDSAQAEVIALESEGRYEEAAKKQFPLLVAAVTNSDDEYVKEIVTSVGSQEAALYLTKLIFEGDMLNQLDDDTVWDAVTNYEYYICKVLDIDTASADMFAQVMDFISGDAYSETRDNTGVGFLRAAESTLVQGGAKANDWWATIAGAAMTGYGHAVKGTNWLVNNTLGKLFGFQLNDTAAEATIEAGQNLDTYYEKISAREDAFMRENATPFEYYAASAGSEAIKMGVQSVAGSAITGKVTQGATSLISGKTTPGATSVSQIMRTKDGYRQLQTAMDLAKLEGFTSHIAAATPFIADSAASEYNATYQETENPVTALVSGLVSGFATASLMNVDAIKNIESMGKFVPDVIDTLTAMPGSGMLAAGKRYGKAGMMYIGNMFKTAANEMIQEPTENFLTTWVTDTLKGKGFFTDRDLGEYASELASDAFYAAIGSFGNTMAAMPSWSRSAIYANRMMGKTGLTPAEVTGQLNAFIEDMNDPQVSSQVNANLEAIAVEARTGELLSEGAMPDVDSSAVVAAEKAVQEKTEVATQATAEKDAAYAQFRENPADNAATSRLSAAVKQEQKAVKDAQDAHAELAEAQASVQAQSEAVMEATRAQARAEVEQASNATASSETNNQYASPEDVNAYIDYAYEYASNPNLAKQTAFIDYAEVSDQLVSDLADYVDITGYVHSLRDNDLRHIRNSHGENTNEKYPVTREDLKRIPDIVENYDDVIYVKRNGKDGIYYVQRHNGVTYYLEAIVRDAASENKRLQNKQMIKVPTGTIPDIKGLKAAIEKKWGPLPAAGDAANSAVPSMYVQDVQEIPTSNSISDSAPPVNASVGVSQFAAQTGQNTDALDDETKKKLLNDPFYTTTSQKKTLAIALDKISKEGYESRRDKMLQGDTNLLTPEGQTEIYALCKMAKEKGDSDAEAALAFMAKESGTQLAQSLALRAIFNQMSPAVRLKYVQRVVNKINASYEAKGKDTRIEVPQWLPNALEKANGDTKMIEQLLDDAYHEIAQSMPYSFKDWESTWRYLAMLANPMTHIKNLAAVTAYYPYVATRDKISAAFQSFKSDGNRTRALGPIKKKYKDFASDVVGEYQDILNGGINATTVNNAYAKIDEYRQKGPKWLTAASNFNSDRLADEDLFWKNIFFKRSLASYLQAQNADLENLPPEQFNAAVQFALDDAYKNTFNNANQFAQWLSKIEKESAKSSGTGEVGAYAINTILPYKNTPANVLARGVDFSPVGLVKSLTYDLNKLKKGKITSAEYFDRLSMGVTGVGAVGLGFLLAAMGVLHIDEDELNKKQENSIDILGQNLTIDWAGTAAMPILMGGRLHKVWNEKAKDMFGDEFDLSDIPDLMLLFGDVMRGVTDPMINLSVMQGFKNLVQSASYAGDNVFGALLTRVGTTYISQFVPSLLGAAARIADPTRRTTYTNKNSAIPSDLQYFVQSIQNKIPGLSQNSMPYMDAWGNDASNGPIWRRLLNNLLLPGYSRSIESPDEVEKMLSDLYETSTEQNLPSANDAKLKAGSKSFTVNGETYYMSADEYEKFSKIRGQNAYDLLQELMKSEDFYYGSDYYKLKVVGNIWDYADSKARMAIAPDYKPTTSWVSTTKNPLSDAMEKAAESDKKYVNDNLRETLYSAIKEEDDEEAFETTRMLLDNGVSISSLKTSVTNQFKSSYKEMYEAGDVAGMRELEDTLILLNIGYRKSEFDGWLN